MAAISDIRLVALSVAHWLGGRTSRGIQDGSCHDVPVCHPRVHVPMAPLHDLSALLRFDTGHEGFRDTGDHGPILALVGLGIRERERKDVRAEEVDFRIHNGGSLHA